MKPCRLMNFVGCSTTTGWIFSAHPSWENGKSKKTDESHRWPNHAATSRTALRLLNPPERSSLGCARIDLPKGSAEAVFGSNLGRLIALKRQIRPHQLLSAKLEH